MNPDPRATAEPPDSDGGERKAFLLRLPPDLHAELRSWASIEIRSLNGHIEFLLRDALRRRRDGSGGSATPPG